MTIMAPIMDAVAYLRNQRPPIIHQDIKPSNVIVLSTRDKVTLVDFGVAKRYNLVSSAKSVRHSLTSYEAPEQYNGEPNTRSDIYGLGATFYTLLTGIVPVDAL
jgi:serine/threonine protein kinase